MFFRVTLSSSTPPKKTLTSSDETSARMEICPAPGRGPPRKREGFVPKNNNASSVGAVPLEARLVERSIRFAEVACLRLTNRLLFQELFMLIITFGDRGEFFSDASDWKRQKIIRHC
ncbi:hypothetical protein CesoFtcFv8_019268 [Champsocephalus esox]|uniref:Uncharacterized protein n=1 Tax=Champsocephalus esox TaxID=159716 RepID=A0AAN8BJ83_9TELE|nr:hypothetical protein CesoFtcFv8_019268 [Champsocephalus esox]